MSEAPFRTAAPLMATVKLLRAPNPGPMTLTGTNTYAFSGNQGASWTIVDPGPAIPEHLDQITDLGRIDQVLITHRHADHTESIDVLHARTGAPVRAFLKEHCREAATLQDGEVIATSDTEIKVIHTPGHTSDSVCFILDFADRTRAKVFTGDTILGKGTTILDFPDGTLSSYLGSLDRLAALPHATLLPGHGPAGAQLGGVVRFYQDHRADRLAQITGALERLGVDATDPQALDVVTNSVYRTTPEHLKRAARSSVEAQLHYLTEQSR